jgi:hypothetical protein
MPISKERQEDLQIVLNLCKPDIMKNHIVEAEYGDLETAVRLISIKSNIEPNERSLLLALRSKRIEPPRYYNNYYRFLIPGQHIPDEKRDSFLMEMVDFLNISSNSVGLDRLTIPSDEDIDLLKEKIDKHWIQSDNGTGRLRFISRILDTEYDILLIRKEKCTIWQILRQVMDPDDIIKKSFMIEGELATPYFAELAALKLFWMLSRGAFINKIENL